MPTMRDRPYTGFNFIVEIGGEPAGGFQEVSGLSIDVDVIEYRSGSDKVNSLRRMPGLHRVNEITLKRGVMGTTHLFKWIQDVSDGVWQPSALAIRLLPEDHSDPAMVWILRNCWPARYACGPLDARKSAILMEELVLTAEGLTIE